MYDLKVFGQNLQRWRQFRRLTQGELAAKVGVTKDTISRLEINKAKRFGLEHLVSICEILNVKIEELFFEDPQIKYSKGE